MEGTIPTPTAIPAGTRRRSPPPGWWRALRVAAFILLVAGVYGLLPRLGGLGEEAAVLRHAYLWAVAGALAAEAGSLALYVVFYRRVLQAMGTRPSFRTVLEVTLASFVVSHVVVGGSAAGMVVNVEAMRHEGVDPEIAGEAAAVVAPLVSSIALLALFTLGMALSLPNEALPDGYLAIIAVAGLLILGGLGLALLAARRPELAERVGRAGAGRFARRRPQWSPAAHHLRARAHHAVASIHHRLPAMHHGLPAVHHLAPGVPHRLAVGQHLLGKASHVAAVADLAL